MPGLITIIGRILRATGPVYYQSAKVDSTPEFQEKPAVQVFMRPDQEELTNHNSVERSLKRKRLEKFWEAWDRFKRSVFLINPVTESQTDKDTKT